MGLGILEPAGGGHVPGTSFMGTRPRTHEQSGELDPGLKYDTSGPVPILLIPQPSNDPNDPLNWSLRQRDSITVILCLVSVLASCLSSILAANTLYLALAINKPLSKVAVLTGYHLCGIGGAGIVIVATARIWGKRHLYVMGTLLLCLSSIWAGAAQGYKSLVAARVVQGISVSPFEALVNASVGDMYCVHQRGKRMALTNFALFGGAFMTPIVVGKITSEIGWRWTFYFVGIFAGVLFPFVILFCPETAYRRPMQYNIDQATDSLAQILEKSGRITPAAMDFQELAGAKETKLGDPEPMEVEDTLPSQRDSFIKRLSLFNGRKADDALLKLIFRPLVLIFHPAVFWGMLTQGTLIGCTVLIGVVLASIFIGAPTFFTEVEVGYMYTGGFLGAVIGFLSAGVMADQSARLLTKWNKGVFEPEFRVLLVLPQALIGGIGVFMFGYTSDNLRVYGWVLPDIFFGMEVMGMIIGAVASSLYIVDAHRNIAVEAFTTFLMFKNFFSYGLTTGAFDWVVQFGVWKLFWIIGMVQVGVCALSVPMYLFGKRNRRLMRNWDLLRICKLY